MAKLKLNVPDAISTGKMVSFIAPCNCSDITCLQINDVDYPIVDATGTNIASCKDVWISGALITVCLDVDNAKAYIQNPGHLAKKSTMLVFNIDPNSWNGSSAPYNQSFIVSGVTPTSVVEISLPSTTTKAQVEAFQKLNLQDGGQSTNTITLRAFGTKNTIAIPINVIVRGDM